jgi:hypothetical protein
MARFLIESPHTPEECLKALGEVLAKGADVLGKYDFGCMAGNHTGYALVDAPNESAAKALVPTFIQNKSRVVQVGKLTRDQIAGFHKK